MGKKINIQILESSHFLKNLYLKKSCSLKRDRIKTLIYIKDKKFCYKSHIARKLGRSDKSIRLWLRTYKKSGLDSLLKIDSGGNNTRIISKRAEVYIENHILNLNRGAINYIELQYLLKKRLGEYIKYGTLYSHCSRLYEKKLKK